MQLNAGDIDRDRDRLAHLRLPAGELATGLGHDPAAQFDDGAGFFQQRDELIRARGEVGRGRCPAQQGFHTGNGEAAGILLHLVDEVKAVFVDATTQGGE